MLSVTHLFSFLAGNEGFAATGDSAGSFAWTGSVGSPVGCVSIVPANASWPSEPGNHIYKSVTWEDLGVPPGKFALYVSFAVKEKYLPDAGVFPGDMAHLAAFAGGVSSGFIFGGQIPADTDWHDYPFRAPAYEIPNANHASSSTVDIGIALSGIPDDAGTAYIDEFALTLYYRDTDLDLDTSFTWTPQPNILVINATQTLTFNRDCTFAMELPGTGLLSVSSGTVVTYTAPATPGFYYLDAVNPITTDTLFVLFEVRFGHTCLFLVDGGYQNSGLDFSSSGVDVAVIHDGDDSTGQTISGIVPLVQSDDFAAISAGVNFSPHSSPGGIPWVGGSGYDGVGGGGILPNGDGGGDLVFHSFDFAGSGSANFQMHFTYNTGNGSVIVGLVTGSGITWTNHFPFTIIKDDSGWRWTGGDVLTFDAATGTLLAAPNLIEVRLGRMVYLDGVLIFTATSSHIPGTFPQIGVFGAATFGKIDDFSATINVPPHHNAATVGVYLGETPYGVKSVEVTAVYSGLGDPDSPTLLEISDDASAWAEASGAVYGALPDHAGTFAAGIFTITLPSEVVSKYWRLSFGTLTSETTTDISVREVLFLNASGDPISCSPEEIPCTTYAAFTGDIALLTRSIPSGLAASLAAGSPTLCVCVKLTRADSVTLGFTTHDEDLLFDAVTYEALASIGATTLRQQEGTGIDNMELIGLLSSEKITEADCRAQRYDAAQLWIYVVDWTNVADRTLVLLGVLGELTLTDGQYRAEVRAQMQRFTQQIGLLTSPLCRWRRFCDSDCALAEATFTHAAVVDSLGTLPRIFNATLTGGATWPTVGGFDYGVARVTSGDNSGLEREIKAATGASGTGTVAKIELQEPFPFPLTIGATVSLIRGCDRRTETCLLYSNIVNFGGEPYVPGTDKISQTGRGH